MDVSPLLKLPLELIALVCSYLPIRDIKSLRLAGRATASSVKLRIHRVFLSASPKDVDVFRCVAEHEYYRLHVREIIWDDAVLSNDDRDRDRDRDSDSDRDSETANDKGCPHWFATACEENVHHLKAWYREDLRVDTETIVARLLPLSVSWAYFCRWRQQQQRVIQSGADVSAFAFGLAQFPSLCSIEVTPAMHGRTLKFPLYATPAIRALPDGLNYPLRPGWMATEEAAPQTFMPAWVEDGAGCSPDGMWRGAIACLQLLAQAIRATSGAEEARAPLTITRLAFDAHYLDAGLNCRMFDQPCRTYDNLLAVLRQPGMRSFHLALSVGGEENRNWHAFRSMQLCKALDAIGPDLEELAITTDIQMDNLETWLFLGPERRAIGHHVPLRTIFSAGLERRWPRLKTLRLSGFLVTKDDLLGLLASLPPSLRRLELGDLRFLASDQEDAEQTSSNSWHGLLCAMRDTLGWRERPADQRVYVTAWFTTFLGCRRPGRITRADECINAFLYGDGADPFTPGNVVAFHLRTDAETEIDDAFDPEYRRPNKGPKELMELGYIRKDPFFFPELRQTPN
ncbi:MAG: hypothetical protein STHCBS139747_006023 [Sporothrix thermara]